MTNTPVATPIWQRLLAAVLLVACLWGIWLSWQWGTGNLYMRQGQQLIQHWQHGGRYESELAEQAQRSLRQAIERHPQHPNYPMVLGKLHQWQAFLDADVAYSGLIAAQEQFQLASELRAGWPATWMDLAQVSFELNGNRWQDDSRYYWLQAQQSGPYFEPVVRTEIPLILTAWPQLSVLDQQLFLAKLSQIQQHHGLSRLLFQSAQQQGQLPVICTYVAISPATEALRSSYLHRQHC